uniref:SFRICE_018062 n=1 Tax=Spodoptera frugiperda TaxID=7108 RepID=A0A2H1WBK8_SPOFR
MPSSPGGPCGTRTREHYGVRTGELRPLQERARGSAHARFAASVAPAWHQRGTSAAPACRVRAPCVLVSSVLSV